MPGKVAQVVWNLNGTHGTLSQLFVTAWYTEPL